VAYISDAKKIPEQTQKLIEGVDLLILDMLRLEDPHPSHFILPDTLQEIRLVRPKKSLLIGMNHMVDHESTNVMLKDVLLKEGMDVQLAYDGLCIPFQHT